jgi:uncharacterized protein
MRFLSQFLIGLLFGCGLVISGMSNPAKVLNFLDLMAIRTGTWDPSLMFVMGGGVVVTFIGYRLLGGRTTPVLASSFEWPTLKTIDRPLVAGAAIFGIGWGLAGFCPGPAFTALGTLQQDAMIFVVAMLLGMFAAWQWRHRNRQLVVSQPG